MVTLSKMSRYSGTRVITSQERGIRYRLPCGKFENYSDQIRHMAALLCDVEFGTQCQKAAFAFQCTAKRSSALALGEVPVRKLLSRHRAAADALLWCEDLVAARLMHSYCAEFHRPGAEAGRFTLDRFSHALLAVGKSSRCNGRALWELAVPAGVPAAQREWVRKSLLRGAKATTNPTAALRFRKHQCV